jgi:hypothetical protein
MSAGEEISGNSSKRRRSEDRRVLRKIFDSAYSPNVGEGEFCEGEPPLYGVLRSSRWASLGGIIGSVEPPSGQSG